MYDVLWAMGGGISMFCFSLLLENAICDDFFLVLCLAPSTFCRRAVKPHSRQLHGAHNARDDGTDDSHYLRALREQPRFVRLIFYPLHFILRHCSCFVTLLDAHFNLCQASVRLAPCIWNL
eukprot:GEMP01070821.1.p1 GENE.GEMP01070821.1~~GEMP01070821.1.p1  ORF type:complete len:121 (-),score=21.51 GEMP01070821.1:403-765(-)